MLGELSEDFSTRSLQLERFHLFEDISTILSLQNSVNVTDHFLTKDGSVGRQNL
jgi:hypothetical protein